MNIHSGDFLNNAVVGFLRGGQPQRARPYLERALELLNDSNARLAQANKETEAARADLANAIETVQEGFALFNRDEELVLCNSRFGMHMPDIQEQLNPGLRFADYVEAKRALGEDVSNVPEARFIAP